jgi:single-strand DNA-binding protein
VFDTNIVVVGNVLTAPEWRRTASTNTLVANFRVASTARRLDRESGRWVDGNQFRVRVICWRKLAEGVASSITVGDPVVVAGRLYTRDWTDTEGNPRTAYEMEAVSVGHDLARGRGRFFRTKPSSTSSTSGPETQIRGETTMPVPEDEAPTTYGDGILNGDEPTFADVPPTTPGGFDPLAALRGGTIEPFDTSMVIPPRPASGTASNADAGAAPGSGTAAEPDSGSESEADQDADTGRNADTGQDAEPGQDPESGGEADSGDAASPAEPGAETPEMAIAVEPLPAEPGTRRGRGRGSRRQPVPA